MFKHKKQITKGDRGIKTNNRVLIYTDSTSYASISSFRDAFLRDTRGYGDYIVFSAASISFNQRYNSVILESTSALAKLARLVKGVKKTAIIVCFNKIFNFDESEDLKLFPDLGNLTVNNIIFAYEPNMLKLVKLFLETVTAAKEGIVVHCFFAQPTGELIEGVIRQLCESKEYIKVFVLVTNSFSIDNYSIYQSIVESDIPLLATSRMITVSHLLNVYSLEFRKNVMVTRTGPSRSSNLILTSKLSDSYEKVHPESKVVTVVSLVNTMNSIVTAPKALFLIQFYPYLLSNSNRVRYIIHLNDTAYSYVDLTKILTGISEYFEFDKNIFFGFSLSMKIVSVRNKRSLLRMIWLYKKIVFKVRVKYRQMVKLSFELKDTEKQWLDIFSDKSWYKLFIGMMMEAGIDVRKSFWNHLRKGRLPTKYFQEYDFFENKINVELYKAYGYPS